MDLTTRLLRLLGLELDFEISLYGDPFDRVSEGLWVGVRPKPEHVPRLVGAGITHVVSCLEPSELAKLELEGAGFTTLGIPLRDGMHEDVSAAFPRFFDFATAALDDPASALLVHCEAGVSRSATFATALLMKREGRTFFDAFEALRAKRAGVLPNIGFASQLQQLERTLHPDRRDELSSLARYLREVCRAPVEAELLEEVLERHDYDAPRALRAMFGGEIPRVVQGVRS